MNPLTLTPKQARFVEEYALDHNGTQAAVRAGYAPGSARVSASRLLTNAAVREAVDALERRNAEQLQITQQQVLEELKLAIQIAKQKSDPHAMIKGWVQIAKICGFYAPERKKIEVSATSRRVIDYMETLSKQELLEIAEGSGSSH
jgi:phage terminase small subunit